MNTMTTIGIDLAKRVFQVHGIDQEGEVVLRKQLRRGQVLKFFATLSPCVVGMEACGSAHHWARELQAQGHDVRLIPPQYVRPFLKTNKHDAADAEAIAEALVRPTMRFTPIKSADQQAVLMLHRSRELLNNGRCSSTPYEGIVVNWGWSRARGRRGSRTCCRSLTIRRIAGFPPWLVKPWVFSFPSLIR